MHLRTRLAPLIAATAVALAAIGGGIAALGYADPNLVVPRVDQPSLLLYAAVAASVVLAWRRRTGIEYGVRISLELLVLAASASVLIMGTRDAMPFAADYFAGFGRIDALLMLLLASALIADHSNTGLGRGLSRALASSVILACISIVIVYAYDVPVRYFIETGLLTLRPVQTIPVGLLAISIIALHPDKGLPSLLTDSTLPAAQLRVLLPAVILLPLLVGLLTLQVSTDLDMSLAVALTALGSAVMAALVVMASTGNLSLAENALFIREQALKAAGEPIFLIDYRQPGYPILWTNDAFERLTGYSRSDVIGQNFPFLRISGQDGKLLFSELEKALARGDQQSIGVEFIRKDGTTFWSRLAMSPVVSRARLSQRSRITHYVGFITDLTAEREREQKLAASNEKAAAAMSARDSFVSYIEHELRTPLNAAQTWIDLMQLNPAPETLEKGLNVLSQSVRTQTKLITDLSDVARVTAGKLTLERQRFDLHDSLEVLHNEVSADFTERELDLQSKLGSGPVWMDGDEIRLQQVVRNLLNNARRYTASGGHVTLGLETNGGVATITVVDDGKGIDATDLKSIFEPYWRADGSIKGLGIGLALARAIVEGHGGQLTATSPGPGLGAEFTVSLPLSLPNAGEAVEVKLAASADDD